MIKKASFYTREEAEQWANGTINKIEECESKKDKLHPIYYKVTVYINK
jgi:hypothetical protein